MKLECYLILKVQENKFHIKMNNRKVLDLIQYTVKKISSLKAKKAYSEDILKKQVKMSQDQKILRK